MERAAAARIVKEEMFWKELLTDFHDNDRLDDRRGVRHFGFVRLLQLRVNNRSTAAR